MKRKQLIKSLYSGEYGNDIADIMEVSSIWVKEEDDIIYNSLLEMLEEFVEDDVNLCTEKDMKEFKNGDWVVQYVFRVGGIAYTAGRNSQDISNQPEWFEDKWEDIPTRQIMKYYKKLKKTT